MPLIHKGKMEMRKNKAGRKLFGGKRYLAGLRLYGAPILSLKSQHRDRWHASLYALVDNYHHILGITLCATTWGNAQAFDFIAFSFAAEK
jgi:hypothetical protein